jgi:hypothetical protein
LLLAGMMMGLLQVPTVAIQATSHTANREEHTGASSSLSSDSTVVQTVGQTEARLITGMVFTNASTGAGADSRDYPPFSGRHRRYVHVCDPLGPICLLSFVALCGESPCVIVVAGLG